MLMKMPVLYQMIGSLLLLLSVLPVSLKILEHFAVETLDALGVVEKNQLYQKMSQNVLSI